MSILLEKANSLPIQPGVYIMKDKTGRVIYVGKSRKLKSRVSQYFQNSEKNIKTAKMVASVHDFDYIICATEIEALTLENSLIKQYSPRYNIRLKDAKSYPYIKITQEEYPRITVTRRRDADKAKYFGPYSGMSTAYSVIGTLRRTLGLPSCKRVFPRDIGKDRPCIYYQMGRCRGVCTGKVTPEEYGSIIRCAADILRGNTAPSRRELAEKMMKYAENEQFEAASRARDTIRALEALSAKQHMVGAPGSEEDIIALYSDELGSAISVFYVRDGALTDKSEFTYGADEIFDSATLASFICRHYALREYIPRTICTSFELDDEDKKLTEEYLRRLSGHTVEVKNPKRGELRALCEVAVSNAEERAKQYQESVRKDDGVIIALAEQLALEVVPERIEAYDISNLGSEHITAGMIVIENGKFRRSDYRIFGIKSVTQGTDDYASMREAISRRFAHLDDEGGAFATLPDLILLDGGRGHVSVIKELLSEMGLDIPVFGMVKDSYHKTRALCTEDGEINIAREQKVFVFIYKIQEEVHRFTVSRMDSAKRKTLKRSSLETVKGIGPAKAKALLAAFGGTGKLREATEAEIATVKGISTSDAKNIFEHFHGDSNENNNR
ncbi:MAG: excinuclease ABC subunit UvrC [Ruminococcaceae bacterium]|nr:excinuclease ABC subunit UvrC [Oscillospiraceae bacterium]